MKSFVGCLAVLICINCALAVNIPTHLVPDTSEEVQGEAVQALIKRTVGKEGAKHFLITIDKALQPRSYHLSKTSENRIFIVASDGVSAAKAFHHYLKYHLHEDITWYRPSIQLPSDLDLPNITLSSTSASFFIYYQNVCTWGYSFAWWDWGNWRQHIDWMAMMGISLTIAPVQEFVWNQVYLEMGLTEDEITEHFAGPAFQPWQRMGNIRGWAGPLTLDYQRMQMFLQKAIIKAQRDLGMSVAVPAFAGHLPVAFKRLYPNISGLTPVERWNSFPDPYCCSLFLDPNEPLFQDIAQRFLKRTIETFGSNHIYFADPFNEIQPRLAEADYLNMTAHHIYQSMRAVDPQAIWLLQGWMFVKNIFWSDDLVKAFLTAVPQGKLLVLDLQSEQFPQYEVTRSFHGQPFIWCMLHNFGGTLGMHGSVDVVNTRIRMARDLANSTMIGVGITPEGINQNYAIYALCLERGWQVEDLNLEEWFSRYADITYGARDGRLRAAWRLLMKSVYSYYGLKKMRGKYAITRRPALNLDIWTWYNSSAVEQAWSLLLKANGSVSPAKYEAYEHDLVDITRQNLQNLGDKLYVNLVSSYKKLQLDRFLFVRELLQGLFADLEAILASNEHFLLGTWLESSRRMVDSDIEKRLLEMNARNQITAWGPSGQILDYATKQWAGIVEDYYAPRWHLFTGLLEQSMRNNMPFNGAAFKRVVSNEIETPFSTNFFKTYPVKPTGNTLDIAQRIYEKWRLNFQNSTFLHNCRLQVRKIKNY